MTAYLFTVYSIKTMVTTVEADSPEEARQIVDDENSDLSWLMIPEATYNFLSIPFEEKTEE